MVVFLAYMAMYLIRNNFKAAQPFLKEQYGMSTLELGYIGLAFSIVYGIGKTALGYFIDGKNTKRIISALLIGSSIAVMLMGFILSAFGSVVGVFIVLWGLNGVFQSAGGLLPIAQFIVGYQEQDVQPQWVYGIARIISVVLLPVV